jgi:hypothetical protein
MWGMQCYITEGVTHFEFQHEVKNYMDKIFQCLTLALLISRMGWCAVLYTPSACTQSFMMWVCVTGQNPPPAPLGAPDAKWRCLLGWLQARGKSHCDSVIQVCPSCSLALHLLLVFTALTCVHPLAVQLWGCFLCAASDCRGAVNTIPPGPRLLAPCPVA